MIAVMPGTARHQQRSGQDGGGDVEMKEDVLGEKPESWVRTCARIRVTFTVVFRRRGALGRSQALRSQCCTYPENCTIPGLD